MFSYVESPYHCGTEGEFDLSSMKNSPGKQVDDKKALQKQLKKLRQRLGELQHQLYAENKQALLVVFQAMDAAGKDGTIRRVFNGVNPTGCQVSSFKQPTSEELGHDFLWRSVKKLPEKGLIGVFNRSYYEEALVVRVHPEYLAGQCLPDERLQDMDAFWQQRFESINTHERHLVNSGTRVVKFWLNVSKDEQKARFLSRLNEPEKHWKFSSSDVKERGYWDEYMAAYQDMISNTSTPYAPWYAIPADNKPYMRLKVAEILVKTLESMNPQYPEVSAKEKATFSEMKAKLGQAD